jgi:hypothetical protein
METIFQVQCNTKLGEHVYLAGSVASLGQWDSSKAVQLQTTAGTYPQWRSKAITLHSQDIIEYKYILVNELGSIQWEACPNRQVPKISGAPGSVLLKDRFHRRDESSAHVVSQAGRQIEFMSPEKDLLLVEKDASETRQAVHQANESPVHARAHKDTLENMQSPKLEPEWTVSEMTALKKDFTNLKSTKSVEFAKPTVPQSPHQYQVNHRSPPHVTRSPPHVTRTVTPSACAGKTSDKARRARSQPPLPQPSSPQTQMVQQPQPNGQRPQQQAQVIQQQKNGDCGCKWHTCPFCNGGNIPEMDVSCVSLGAWCGVSQCLRGLKFRTAAYPFDWNRVSMDGVLHFLENKFEDFLQWKTTKDFPWDPDHGGKAYCGEHHSFWHDDLSKPEEKKKYDRRIERFFNNPVKKLLFIRAANELAEVSKAEKLLEVLNSAFPDNDVWLLILIDHQPAAQSYVLEGTNGRLMMHTTDKRHIRTWMYYDDVKAYEEAVMMALGSINSKYKSVRYRQPRPVDSISALVASMEPFYCGNPQNETWDPKPLPRHGNAPVNALKHSYPLHHQWAHQQYQGYPYLPAQGFISCPPNHGIVPQSVPVGSFVKPPFHTPGSPFQSLPMPAQPSMNYVPQFVVPHALIGA